MRSEFVYSLAALAAFPIVVNAQVEVVNGGKITVNKDGATPWTLKEDLSFVKGKYSLIASAPTGTAEKKVTVTILKDGYEYVKKEFKVGTAIKLDFELDEAASINVKVQGDVADADYVISESLIQLNFDFTKVAELLQIEYNKVTEVLRTAEYKEKDDDAQVYSALYNRIVAIAKADYPIYTENKEGLQALYAGNQTDVTGLALYTDIQEALADVTGKEKTYQLDLLDGDDGLGGLNGRYDKLGYNYAISYVTDALTAKKTAAQNARDAYDADATGDKLLAAKNAIAAYKAELVNEEAVKDTNEKAKKNIDDAWTAVYDTYYNQALTQIEAQYAGERYADLKDEVEGALKDLLASTDKTDIDAAIAKAYKDKAADAKQTDLGVQIQEFKEKLTRTVSEYKEVKDALAEIYSVYDEIVKAANELTKGAEGFLTDYQDKVNDAVDAYLDEIRVFDTFDKVDDFDGDALLKAIEAAEAEYKAQAAIYDVYKALQADVAAQTTYLNDVKTEIDKDAKDTKKLDENVFKPTKIWATTISAIEDQISALKDNVDLKATTANTYKDSKEYKEDLAAIKSAISALNSNALAATDKYAEIAGQIKTADDLRKALIDLDLTTLNVWTNQVTIDDAVKARTPYKAFINDGDGSVTKAIAKLIDELAVAPSKTTPLNEKGDNVNNILPYLNSLASDVKAVTDGTSTMEAIKANYNSDNAKFAEQLEQQECDGIKTNINSKAVVFEPSIEALQKRIKDGEFGNVKGAALQKEIDAITKKINDAIEVAKKADATKEELTTAYNSIKNLDTEDIATAEDLATDYANAFKMFSDNYNTLVGKDTDASSASTLFGLDKKVAEQQAVVNGLAKLSDAQKTTYKNNIAGVSVTKKENVDDKDVDVTYTIASIKADIAKAKGEEVLTDEVVTKYQELIEELKNATAAPVTQAGYMNTLEDLLAAIDFNNAKDDVLKADPNQDGFYYKQLTGQLTSDFNTLKGKIEADTDLTADEYKTDISTLKAKVDGQAAKAEANLDAFKAAKEAYDNATKTYEEQYAKWNALDVKLDTQEAALKTLKDALDNLNVVAKANYDAGKASANDKSNIVAKEDEIKNAVAEYTNPVNYNALVAKDNKATYEGITKAHEDADAAYTTSSSIINTYKNFQSVELKNATEKAQAELQALLTFLTGYDTKVNALQKEADEKYASVVSPDQFDKDKSYKAKFEAIKADLEGLTQALSDKINEYAATEVAASVADYTAAIATSKAKVAMFSDTDKDLSEATVNGLFGNIDGMLDAINDVKDDDTKIKTLDGALLVAEDATSGIKAEITKVEQNQAQTALTYLVAANTNSGLLTGNDLKSFKDISDIVYSTAAANKAKCVANFDSYKTTLNELKAKADQIKKENDAIAAANTAISNANNALATLQSAYQDYAAGYEVKADVDQIAEDIKAYSGTVTVANSADWKAGAETISARIAAVYPVLYEKELVAIEGLITKAKEENLTYGGDKAAMTTAINAQETALNNIKKAVADNDADPKNGKSRTDALADLKTIESALTGLIKTMADDNDTNLDGVIKANLDAQVAALQNELNNSLNVLNGYNVPSGLKTTKNNIQEDINALSKYLTDHADEMAAYQANAKAMLQDIAPQIEALKTAARAEKEAQDKAAFDNAKYSLALVWSQAQSSINTAQSYVDNMNNELKAYGSASNYANKTAKLQEQVDEAQKIYDDAYISPDTYQTTAELQKAETDIAEPARDDINDALVNLDENCKEIIDLAKTAYIDEFIEKLKAQVIADTWTESANYTTTDKQALTDELEALNTSITNLQTDAKDKTCAEDIYYGNGTTNKGVITTLEEGKKTFETALESLKKNVKDMSLAEDKKGHIANDGQNEEIDNKDFIALANILAEGQESELDDDMVARCDVNGDSEVTLTDLVWLRYFTVFHDWPTTGASVREMASDNSDAVSMQVVSVNGNITRLAINLDNEREYSHFLLNIQLPAGAKVVGKSLGERVEGASLISSSAKEGSVRFLAISSSNNKFAGNEGTVLYLDVENLNGVVTIDKASFVDTSLIGHDLTSTSEATGIRETIANALDSATQKFYDVSGRMLNSLKNGINIIRNADGSSKKVLK